MPDPDLEIRGGGWAGRSPKKLFSALRASVWSKNKGGGWGRAPGPFPGSATGNPHPFIYFKPENVTAFGRSFRVKAIVGSTPNSRKTRCQSESYHQAKQQYFVSVDDVQVVSVKGGFVTRIQLFKSHYLVPSPIHKNLRRRGGGEGVRAQKVWFLTSCGRK